MRDFWKSQNSLIELLPMLKHIVSETLRARGGSEIALPFLLHILTRNRYFPMLSLGEDL